MSDAELSELLLAASTAIQVRARKGLGVDDEEVTRLLDALHLAKSTWQGRRSIPKLAAIAFLELPTGYEADACLYSGENARKLARLGGQVRELILQILQED